MNLGLMYARRCPWGISLYCICIFVTQPKAAEAMEWDTAADVAFCANHSGYEKIADRVVSILANHNITIRQEGLVLPTNNSVKAEGFLVLVDVKNASAAKIVLKKAIKEGLSITLLERSILNPSK